MACQVILEFRIKDDCIEKLRGWLKEVLPATRGYKGCISISVIQNQDAPTSIAVVEQWESREHYEEYLQWRTKTGVLNAMVDMMDGEPSFRFFNYFGV